ncbi:MAG: MFS transporter [Acidimicrobiia bacterium]|nr:MFS transporter [Acidimicrobiia bacterium]
MVDGAAGREAAGPEVGPDPRRWWALAVLCLGLSVVSIDNTIVTTALPEIQRELGATQSDLARIADGYTVVFAALLLACGSLADRRGRKLVLDIGLVLFALTSAGAAFAPTPALLSLARVAMGAAGALIMPATLSILMATFPREERAKALGIWTASLGLGIAAGPLAGGILLEHFWWGSIFLVNLPICAIALVGSLKLVRTSRDPSTPPADVPGTVLWTIGIGLVIAGVIEAGEAGLHLAHIGLITTGAVLLVLFVWWERRTPHPMLDLGLFRNPRFTVANLSVALTQFALYGLAFIATQYVQLVLGLSPLQAGLTLLPAIVLVGAVSPFSHVTLRLVGTKVAVAGGLALIVAGLVTGTQLTAHGPYWLVMLMLVFIGLGLGFSLTPAEEAVLGSVPSAKLGVGSAMNDTTLELGGGIGIAVLGTILSVRYQHALARAVHLRGDHLAAAQRSLAHALEEGSEVGAAAKVAFTRGAVTALFVAAAVVAVGVVIAALWLPAHAEHSDDTVVDPDAEYH